MISSFLIGCEFANQLSCGCGDPLYRHVKLTIAPVMVIRSSVICGSSAKKLYVGVNK